MKIDPVTVSLLCDHYGALLTDHQRRCLELHCEEDLSLAEIAEQEGVSRQGIHAAVARAEEALLEYEKKLGCLARAGRNRARIAAARDAAERLLRQENGGSVRDAAEDILRALDSMEE